MREDGLSIEKLEVQVDSKPILHGVNLHIGNGETHVIMGPNGSGKSTLAQSIFGHPSYKKTAGRVIFCGQDITKQTPDTIARLGMLLAFQYPQNIPGVSVTNLLSLAARQKTKDVSLAQLSKQIGKYAETMGLPEEFLTRSLNDGFSGGEKKKTEVLQLAVLDPKLAVFDETDSGLDIDSLRIVGEQISLLSQRKTSILLITHYKRILHYIKPDYVHVMYKGRIIKSGDKLLAEKIEAQGYENIIK